jgi:hypothetical protein
MIDIKGRWERLTDRKPWSARGTSMVAKVKATKAVWFPPRPDESGKKTASTAKKATRKTARKTTAAARKTTGAKKVSKPVARKKT